MIKFRISILIFFTSFSAYAQIVVNTQESPLDIIKLHTLDSIHTVAAKSIRELKHDYDSMEQSHNVNGACIKARIDSLTQINQSAHHLNIKLDSIDNVKEMELSVIKSRLEEVKSRTVDKVAELDLPPELTDMYTGAIGKLDFSIPASTLKIPSPDLTDNIDLSIPGIKTPLQEVNQVAVTDITNTGQLARVAESQVSQLKDVQAVREQFDKLPQTTVSSEEQTKEALLSHAKKIAVDQFPVRRKIS